MTTIKRLKGVDGLMNARRLTIATISTLCALSALAFGAGTASARVHVNAPFELTGFRKPTGIAIDQETGNVYVADNKESVIDVFGKNGGSPTPGVPAQITGFAFESFTPAGLAIDNSCYLHNPRLTGLACEEFDPSNGDLYVANTEGNAIDKLKLNPLSETYELVHEFAFHEPAGVAVDPHGNVYVADPFQTAIAVFNMKAEEVGQINQQDVSTPGYVAADALGDVYVGNFFGQENSGVWKFEVNSKEEILNEPVELDSGGGAIAVDAQNNVYVDETSSISEYSSASHSLETFGAFAISYGVAVNDGTEYVYGSDTQSSHNVQVFARRPTAAPSIGAESFHSVGASGATVTAEFHTEGLQTTYYFEYGTTSAYGSKTPEVTAAASEDATSVSIQLPDLTPGGGYHFRLVATNEDGSENGDDTNFNTLVPVYQGLPDNRVYEMVTPPENQDADVNVPFVGGGFFTHDGYDGVFVRGVLFQAALSGNAITYAAEPTSPGGGGNKGQNGTSSVGGNPYLATRSSSGGWKQINIQPAGYNKANFAGFSSELTRGVVIAGSEGHQAGEAYLPPLAPGVAPGVGMLYTRDFSEEGYHPFFTSIPEHGSMVYAGSSADGSKNFFLADDALTPGAHASDGSTFNIYESDRGRLHLVSILPNDTSSSNARVNAVSEDGSSIVWQDESTGNLYARRDGSVTVSVSQGSAQFSAATPDGRYVLYIEGEKLWRFDVQAETRAELTVQGSETRHLIGVSNDGEYVYFVANGVLTTSANAEGKEPSAGQPNLYMYYKGMTSFIATLTMEDGESVPPYAKTTADPNTENAERGDWVQALAYRTAEVAPDGKALVFMSKQSLTGYDNLGMVENHSVPFEEVYVYQTEDSRLFCASCNRSGEAPQQNANSEFLAAAFLQIGYGTELPRWLSDDGSRVFFDSEESLVPQDTDGKQDVYEWERDGSGSCHEGNGCIYLLSAGESNTDSYFVGAGETGDDVFIVTRAQLVPEDGNEAYDLYDARVGGQSPPIPTTCTGTGCQGLPSAPPVFATPASVTFNGVGNFSLSATASVEPKTVKPPSNVQKLRKALSSCRAEHRKRKRPSCEAQARHRYPSKSKVGRASKERSQHV